MRILSLLLLLTTTVQADEPKGKPTILPGTQADGFVQLPNQWKLNPTGTHLAIGNLPVNIQIHPTGQFAAIQHSGMKEHEVVIVDLNPAKHSIVSRAVVPQSFYGLVFSPDGKQLFGSGSEFDKIHVWDFAKGYLSNPRSIDVSQGTLPMVPAGLAIDPKGRDLFATALWANALIRIPLENPDNKLVIPLTLNKPKPVAPIEKGNPPSPPDGRKQNDPNAEAAPETKTLIRLDGYPYTVTISPDGTRAFVSLWAKAKIAVVDLKTNTMVDEWATAAHPTEIKFSKDGEVMYVACSNSTQVSVLSTDNGMSLQTINAALYPKAPSGNTPNSLDITPDGSVLFVANADANNVAVFNIENPKMAKPMGVIPVGWYPTSVRYDALNKTILVANGKGLTSKANRNGPQPTQRFPRPLEEYIGTLFDGTLSFINMPSPATMALLTKTAYECSPLQKESAVRNNDVADDNPIPKKVGGKSPIKYVIYIVKENRTYDQVFGDLPQGNGEPQLCLFPEKITPNHHKLAKQFVLLDNIYVDGEVSADGHEWSMGAYATDFVERIWPMSYRGGSKGVFGYPAEGAYDEAARPAGGYLWDRAKEAGISYRSYGEWVTNIGEIGQDFSIKDGVATVPALKGHIDPQFRSYDLDYPDVKRAERFISELNRFEQAGDMPQLQIVRLPNDHTYGTRIGKPTPIAMVADNDLALGMVVEALSNSKFWDETAIFVIEDDAQNGPDHVDAHRVTALVISPYTKHGFVDSDFYSTASMLRTMELILGLKPMSQFDAAALPMYNSFTAKKDATKYTKEIPDADLNAKNKLTAWGTKLSEKFNLAKEDQADDLLFNEVIWRSIKGADSVMPAPVRSAWFVPLGDDDDDDDDD